MNKPERVNHSFGPVFNNESRILILGSFPSVKSREISFYYGHPQNRFWKVLGIIYKEDIPKDIEGKKEFLLKNHIALWDVVASCNIIGSSDSSISEVEPNKLELILNNADISKIYVNGTKAYDLYRKLCSSKYKREIVKLPSTSSANAAYSLDRLVNEWSIIKTGD